MGFSIRFSLLLLISAWHFGYVADGAALRDGRFSDVLRDVRLETNGQSFVASNELKFQDGLIRTGRDSRAELSFGDKSTVRLGDNSLVKVDSKDRTFDLESGAILAQVPSQVGGTLVKVRHVTATATGTTLAVEFLPNAYIKFISLDGTSRLCVKKGAFASDCVLLRAGQMIIAGPDPKMLPDAVDVDLNRFLETCEFITKFHPLPGHDRLAKAARIQRDRKSHGSFAETNLVIFGRGTLVSQRNVPTNRQGGPGQDTAAPARSPQQTHTPSP